MDITEVGKWGALDWDILIPPPGSMYSHNTIIWDILYFINVVSDIFNMNTETSMFPLPCICMNNFPLSCLQHKHWEIPFITHGDMLTPSHPCRVLFCVVCRSVCSHIQCTSIKIGMSGKTGINNYNIKMIIKEVIIDNP